MGLDRARLDPWLQGLLHSCLWHGLEESFDFLVLFFYWNDSHLIFYPPFLSLLSFRTHWRNSCVYRQCAHMTALKGIHDPGFGNLLLYCKNGMGMVVRQFQLQTWPLLHIFWEISKLSIELHPDHIYSVWWSFPYVKVTCVNHLSHIYLAYLTCIF